MLLPSLKRVFEDVYGAIGTLVDFKLSEANLYLLVFDDRNWSLQVGSGYNTFPHVKAGATLHHTATRNDCLLIADQLLSGVRQQVAP